MIDWDTPSLLTNLTHLDGRNASKLQLLRPIFSEYAWMRIRLWVMISYAQTVREALSGKKLHDKQKRLLDRCIESFSIKEADAVRHIEGKVNHDVKAIETYLSAWLSRNGLSGLLPFVNLGIGSEDINNIALGSTLRTSRGEVLLPAYRVVIQRMADLASKEKQTVMIARTHGQPANITTFGKEVANTLSRLCDELELFSSHSFSAKCSGEVGSYQAYIGVDPIMDWIAFTDHFVASFGLHPAHAATQIAPYDNLSRYFHSLFRINTILIDFCKNMWLYVLLGYLRVKIVDSEVGSSGMPHKVNPIYFEGAEGGLDMANGIIETFVRTLPVNRLQRDFSDSTMRRNMVLPFAYSLLSYQSIVEALDRITVDRDAIEHDRNNHAEIWTETVKAYGTVHGISDMYERVKKATRGRILSQTDLHDLIDSLPLKKKERQELISLCDGTHNPYPARIVEEVVGRAKRVIGL